MPAVAADLARLAGRVDELAGVRDDLRSLRGELAQLREEVAVPTVPLAIAGVRQDLDELGLRLDALVVPTPEQVAGVVAPRVADQLVERLAPRVAELVLARVAPALVQQVTDATAGAVLAGVADLVHASTADSERRVLAHVDEAVLALAEALLRRRRSARADPGPLAAAATTPSSPGTAREMAFPDIAAPDLDDAAPAGPVDEDGEALPDLPGTGDVASLGGVAAEDAAPQAVEAAPYARVGTLEQEGGGEQVPLDEAGVADTAGVAQDVDGDGLPAEDGLASAPDLIEEGADEPGAGDAHLAGGAPEAEEPGEPEEDGAGPAAAPAELAPEVAALAEPVSPTAGGDDPAVAASTPGAAQGDADEAAEEVDEGPAGPVAAPPYAVVTPSERAYPVRPAVTGALAPPPQRPRPAQGGPGPADPGPADPAPAPDDTDGPRRPWWRPGV